MISDKHAEERKEEAVSDNMQENECNGSKIKEKRLLFIGCIWIFAALCFGIAAFSTWDMVHLGLPVLILFWPVSISFSILEREENRASDIIKAGFASGKPAFCAHFWLTRRIVTAVLIIQIRNGWKRMMQRKWVFKKYFLSTNRDYVTELQNFSFYNNINKT